MFLVRFLLHCRVGGMDQDSFPVFQGFFQFSLTLECRQEVRA